MEEILLDLVFFIITHTFFYFYIKQETSLIVFFEIEGDAVVNVYINHEKKFAFVEMRSVEEASNAMALDGIIFEVYFLLVDLVCSFEVFFSLPSF